MSQEEQEQKLKELEERQIQRRERKEVVKQESAQARIALRHKNRMVGKEVPDTS